MTLTYLQSTFLRTTMFHFSEKTLRYSSVIGAHFLFSSSSFSWNYGNLFAYIDSYFQYSCSRDCRDVSTQWIYTLYFVGIFVGVFLNGRLLKRYKVKQIAFFTIIIANAAYFGSSYVIQLSVLGTAVLLGLILAICNGILVGLSYYTVNMWCPELAGILSATTSSFPTLLSIPQNIFITWYVNPHNLSPNSKSYAKVYFSQVSILDQVPGVIRLLAIMNTALLFVGLVFVSNPPQHSNVSEPKDERRASKQDQESENEQLLISTDAGYEQQSLLSSSHDTHSEHLLNNVVDGYGSLNENDTLPPTQDDQGTTTPADQSDHHSTRTEERSFTTAEAIRTAPFVVTYFFGSSLMYGLVITNNYYKEYGQKYIANDALLTLLGALMPIPSITGRVVFGILLDRGILSIQDTMTFCCAVNSFLYAFFYLSAQFHPVVYMLLVMGLTMAQSLLYVVLPTVSLRLFGSRNFANNFAAANSSSAFGSLLAALIVSPVLDSFGWFALFTSGSVFSLIALIAAVVTNFNIPKP